MALKYGKYFINEMFNNIIRYLKKIKINFQYMVLSVLADNIKQKILIY